MTHRLVNKIIIEPDGVYLSYKGSHRCKTYNYVKSSYLSNLYLTGGQEALDCRIIEMMADYTIMLHGKDRSLSRYLKIEKSDEFQTLHDMYINHISKFETFDDSLACELINSMVYSMKNHNLVLPRFKSN